MSKSDGKTIKVEQTGSPSRRDESTRDAWNQAVSPSSAA